MSSRAVELGIRPREIAGAVFAVDGFDPHFSRVSAVPHSAKGSWPGCVRNFAKTVAPSSQSQTNHCGSGPMLYSPQRAGVSASVGSGGPKFGLPTLLFLIFFSLSVKAQDSSDLESRVRRVLERRCLSCHNKALKTANLVLTSRQFKAARSAHYSGSEAKRSWILRGHSRKSRGLLVFLATVRPGMKTLNPWK